MFQYAPSLKAYSQFCILQELPEVAMSHLCLDSTKQQGGRARAELVYGSCQGIEYMCGLLKDPERLYAEGAQQLT